MCDGRGICFGVKSTYKPAPKTICPCFSTSTLLHLCKKESCKKHFIKTTGERDMEKGALYWGNQSSCLLGNM